MSLSEEICKPCNKNKPLHLLTSSASQLVDMLSDYKKKLFQDGYGGLTIAEIYLPYCFGLI